MGLFWKSKEWRPRQCLCLQDANHSKGRKNQNEGRGQQCGGRWGEERGRAR